jgi:periplasmic protein TonB
MLREGHAPVWDRLLTTLFFAALLHGLVILGVTFGADAGEKGGAPGLEVLLVSDELPESDRNPTATYLAQRTQLGSGNTRKAVAPHNRAAAATPMTHPGIPEGESLTASSDRAAPEEERVLTTSAWSTDVRYLADSGRSGSASDRPLLLEAPNAEPAPEDETGPLELRGPKRDELWVTADTRAATVAPYLDNWRRKVERIGTLNFPNAARTTGARTNPLLEVALAADGSIRSATIQRSSGDAGLDQAALATLKLASPFDPFPPELAASYRVLHFEYEWQFTGGRIGGGTLTALP